MRRGPTERVLYVRRSIGAYDDPEEGDDRQDQLTTKTEAGRDSCRILDGAQEALGRRATAAVDTRDEATGFATVRAQAWS